MAGLGVIVIDMQQALLANVLRAEFA